MPTFQAEGRHEATTMTLAAAIIAEADTVEISNGPANIIMYTWDDDHRTWREAGGNRRVAGSALWEAINLARAANLTVVAWNDNRRLV